MSNQFTDTPHIIKKGKPLKFKTLGNPNEEGRFHFCSAKPNLQNIVNQCNNMNQIVARNWLNLGKITSYFGLSHDKSDSVSKTHSPFDKFLKDLQLLRGGMY